MFCSRTWLFGAALFVWLCCSCMLNGADGQNITDPTEITALGAIRNSLIDPNGNLSDWNRGDPCTSNWTGVWFYNTTMRDGHLHVRELDVMWNQISGSIPKEVGNITSLELLLLNGNQLTGPLPDEIGYLPKLDRIQIDQNQISGSIPKSFANLNKTKHFHMNNNSLSGQIPPELSTLPNLVHMLLDNNNLSGYLPRELANLPSLLILQLDNNHFDGATIPNSYGNMSHLLKLSLRNCSLQGLIPDLSRIPHLAYIDLSGNNLTGPIPANLSGLPRLQTLSLLNNSLNGSVPASIWQNKTFNGNASLIVDLQNNMLSNISGSVSLPANVTVRLQGNPICSNTNLVQFCGPQNENKTVSHTPGATNSSDNCLVQSCPYEYAPNSPCFCAAPLIVGYRLKSPAFRDFEPYWVPFERCLTTDLELNPFQVEIVSVSWEEGYRLRMNLKIFPVYVDNTSFHVFNTTEVQRIRSMFTGWHIDDTEILDLMNFSISL